MASLFLQRTSARSVEEIRHMFARAARRAGFVYVGCHDVKDLLARKGHIIAKEYLVFEFSHPGSLRHAVQFVPTVLCLSPARIVAFSDGEQTRLSLLSSLAVGREALGRQRFPSHVRRLLTRAAVDHQTRLNSLLDELSR